MTRPFFSFAIPHLHIHLAIAASSLIASLGSAAAGQVANYEIIDLGTLPGASTPESQAFAINNQHEIVGWSRDSSGVYHAVLWLYCPNYGLDEFELHDLTDLASLTDFGQALDINEAGLVVGRQIDSAALARPFLWDLSTLPSLATLELDTFATDPDSEGIAYAVSNSNPAVIVGNAETDDSCFGGGPLYRAFKYVEGDSASALANLGVVGSDTFSAAHDVNSATTPAATGVSENLCTASQCDADFDSVSWSLGTSVTLSALPDNGASYGSLGYGVNDSGHSTGLIKETSSSCLRHASFWASPTATPVDLGTVGIQTGDETVAYEMSNAGSSGEVYVVGTNFSSDSAVRWYRNASGTWSSVDLNGTISPMCGWDLKVAYDVSDDGWIVGYGEIDGEIHGFLLKPIECEGDLDRDCDIDGADLGILLAGYSCSTPCPGCVADLDLDGDIDGGDLGILLANWEASCECFSCLSSFMSESISSGPDLASALQDALTVLGFESVPDFINWSEEASSEQRAGTLDWLMSYLTSQL